MIELRPYQKEAVEHALRCKRAILVLPTGSGKTIIGAFFLKKLFESCSVRRALVLVPTRILVEQTCKVYGMLGLRAKAIYGIYTKDKRRTMWEEATIAVSTPETVYSDLEFVKVDAVVVDECHHAVGDDAYAKVLRELNCEYRLGLSAFIPKRRRKEVEELIGEIREWEVKDLRPFIAEWIGEIFETPLDSEEMRIYDEIDRRRSLSKGKDKLIYTSALKFFAKDGALALKESLNKKTRLSKLLADLKEDVERLRDLHKLDHLKRAFEIYEDFNKAIVFVDRVIVAKRLVEEVDYDVALVVGGRRKEEMLENAKRAEVIVSTSAGEEGLDLPTADLLINWSNTSSPLRFIQRHGRIMRKTGKDVKFVVYLVTPETVDTDDLILSIDRAKKFVDINVDRDVLERLWRKSRRYRIVELLSTPMPLEWIRDLTGRTLEEVKFALRKAVEEGDVIYIYTHLGKTFVRRDRISELKKFDTFLKPKHLGKVKIKVGERTRTILGDYERLKRELKKYLPLPKLEVTVIKRSGDLEEYEYRRYDFPIDEVVLDIVLRNALS